MEQKVRIREILPDGTALVVHVRESACSGDCHKCAGCGAAKETITFRAANPIGAAAGDVVTVSSASGPVLRAAAVTYLLPLVLFFLGYALWGGWGGGAGFGLGVAGIVVYDRRVAQKERTEYTITGYARKKGDNDLG